MKTSRTFILLATILVCYNIVNAQIKEHDWGKETPELVTIPEKFVESNAVITYYKQRYAVDQHYTLYFTVHKRIRILTQKGLDKYARIYVPTQYEETSIDVMDARTIKKDGSIVDMNVSDIKELDVPHDDFANNVRYKIFSIPGAEVGDEVEFVYVIKNSGFSPVIYLQQDLPVLRSLYELRLPKILFMDIITYNGMVKPHIKETQEVTTYTWDQTDLLGFGEDVKSIRSLTIPYIFQAYKRPELNMMYNSYQASDTKWADLLDKWNEFLKLEASMSLKYTKSYSEFIESSVKGIESTDTISKIVAIHRALNKKMTINNGYVIADMPLTGYLEKGTISEYMLTLLYLKILKDQGVNFSMLFCKNMYNGPFDLTVPDLMQVDQCGYGVTDEAGNMYILFPKQKGNAFATGEIPTDLQGTSAVIVNAQTKEEGALPLPQIEGKDNFRFRKIQVTVDMATGTVKKKAQESLSGCYSAMIRPEYIVADNKGKLMDFMVELTKDRELTDKVENVSFKGPELTYPYDSKLNYELTQSNAISQFEGDLFQLDIANWMYHNIENPGDVDRKLTYYPEFGRKDQFKYYIVFDGPVELVNAENLNTEVAHPKIGAYQLSIKQVNPTVLLVESNYIVSGAPVEFYDIEKLVEMNDALEQATQTPIIFKKL